MSERYQNFEGLVEQSELAKLQKSSVLIAGCGAGGPVALHLARIGVGTKVTGAITLADPDKVEWRNIGRPPYLFDDAAAGRPKTDALDALIKNINPDVKVNKVQEGITLENVGRLVAESDVVIEMVDISRPEITLALHQACERQSRPLVTGLDIGDNIILYVFDYSKPNYTSYLDFFGLPASVTPEDFRGLNPLAITAQLIIGKQERQFTSKKKALDFYKDTFFASDDNINDIFTSLPQDARTINMVQGILNGRYEHIAQTDIASQLLGTIQALAVKQIILDKPIKAAPSPIRVYLSEIVSV
jgi:molybdopterin/thiamine biosynthesis adenylyltransferase